MLGHYADISPTPAFFWSFEVWRMGDTTSYTNVLDVVAKVSLQSTAMTYNTLIVILIIGNDGRRMNGAEWCTLDV